jgi:hypothetical protein
MSQMISDATMVKLGLILVRPVIELWVEYDASWTGHVVKLRRLGVMRDAAKPSSSS